MNILPPGSFRRRCLHWSFILMAVLAGGCSSKGPLKAPLPSVAHVGEPSFQENIGATLSGGFLTGNRIETLENGNQIFPAMLAAIHSAKRSVNFETFVYYGDETGRIFTDALIERARAGVPVRVIIDAVGGNKSLRYRREMKAAGVDVQVYHPLIWIDPFRANHRTHRKLLIVDGRVGFIGGVGIGDEWQGNAEKPEHWHDLHYRLQGPVVTQLQSAFLDNWLKVARELVQGPAYFPELKSAGPMMATAFSSSPIRSRYSSELMYHLSLASARQTVCIENPYFLPDKVLMQALCDAAQRGVKVQVILPGKHNDQKNVRRASRKRFPRLLRAGVRLYEYEPTMNHTKLLVVDGLFVSIGSTNLDPRSLRINDEANVNIIDRAFARSQEQIFQRDLRKSREVRVNAAGHLTEAPLQLATTPVESQL
ncbi:MAG: phospholipase D-like domain-containing protein [Chthoniobacterales bacterium]